MVNKHSKLHRIYRFLNAVSKTKATSTVLKASDFEFLYKSKYGTKDCSKIKQFILSINGKPFTIDKGHK